LEINIGYRGATQNIAYIETIPVALDGGRVRPKYSAVRLDV
jgi:hypothetical protein